MHRGAGRIKSTMAMIMAVPVVAVVGVVPGTRGGAVDVEQTAPAVAIRIGVTIPRPENAGKQQVGPIGEERVVIGIGPEGECQRIPIKEGPEDWACPIAPTAPPIVPAGS